MRMIIRPKMHMPALTCVLKLNSSLYTKTKDFQDLFVSLISAHSLYKFCIISKNENGRFVDISCYVIYIK